MNALLEKYLRHFVIASEKNWLDLLNATQFFYNMHQSSSTGMSPFEIVIGLQPRAPLEVIKQHVGQENPVAHLMAKSRQETFDEARESLEKAARQMKKYVDQHHRPLEFQVGD